MGGPDPRALGLLPEVYGQVTSLPGPNLQSKSSARSFASLTPQGLNQTLSGHLLQPAFRTQGFLFLLASLRRGKHPGTPKKQSRLSSSGFGRGHAEARHPQPSPGKKSCGSQPSSRRGPEAVLERCNSRWEGGGPPPRRECHAGPAPEPPRGAAPRVPAAHTHCPLISPRKDVCLLQGREPERAAALGFREEA